MKRKITGVSLMLTAAVAAIMAVPMQAMAAGNFDPNYYVQTYGDVRNVYGSDVDALYNHYLMFGMAEGRIPYEGAVPGEAVDGIADTQVQLPAAGKFNPSHYAQAYKDVRNVFGTDAEALYNHYLMYGMAEGRVPYEGAVPGEAVDGIADAQTPGAVFLPKIEKTVDRWANKNPNMIGTTVIGKSLAGYTVGSVVPFRLTLEVPKMKIKNGVTLACRAIITDTLPDGMTYNEHSLSVYAGGKPMPATAYTLSVSGQKIEVTINGLNMMPFDAKEGDEIVVIYHAIMNSTAEFQSIASVRYDYGTFTRTWTGEYNKYTIPVCQYCGYRAETQSKIKDHQLVSGNLEHALANGLIYDYSDPIYQEGEFIVEAGYTIELDTVSGQ